ncbi:hypothetical protein [Pectobacterium polaris]|uniref:hypothetical protein n=1 Tax=Pectobacterium polaris TaxID=2042057 RepID=UPI0021CAAE5E|nr:hypothetical protein [Pectobacterium polaris]MCU1793408.1 hypothetical protein [Pectobacterium polaris]
MKKKLINTILLGCAILCTVAISSYFINFHEMPISNKTSDWSNFGSYVAGTLGPLLSLVSILFILKSIAANNENHDALMNFSTQDKIYNQIKDLSDVLKKALENNEIFKDKRNSNIQIYSYTVLNRITSMMSFRGNTTIDGIAINAVNDSYNVLKYEVLLLQKIISLLGKLSLNDREVYQAMLEVKLTNAERAVLYCFACKDFPLVTVQIHQEWPTFRGDYFDS